MLFIKESSFPSSIEWCTSSDRNRWIARRLQHWASCCNESLLSNSAVWVVGLKLEIREIRESSWREMCIEHWVHCRNIVMVKVFKSAKRDPCLILMEVLLFVIVYWPTLTRRLNKTGSFCSFTFEKVSSWDDMNAWKHLPILICSFLLNPFTIVSLIHEPSSGKVLLICWILDNCGEVKLFCKQINSNPEKLVSDVSL